MNAVKYRDCPKCDGYAETRNGHEFDHCGATGEIVDNEGIMIDRETAQNQLLRLGGLRFPPAGAGMTELADTLIGSARSEMHCRRIISAYLDKPFIDPQGNRHWPTPDMLSRIAWGLLEDEEKQGEPCQNCGGTGWVHLVLKGYDFCKRCPKCTAPAPQSPLPAPEKRSGMSSAGKTVKELLRS